MNNIDYEMEEKLKEINNISNRQLYDFNNRLGYDIDTKVSDIIVNYDKYNSTIQDLNPENSSKFNKKNTDVENSSDDLENHIKNLILNSNYNSNLSNTVSI